MSFTLDRPLRYAEPPPEAALESILRVPWFRDCELDPLPALGLQASRISDWRRAAGLATSRSWENFQLERHNDFHKLLRRRAPDASREWNVLAKAAREWIAASVDPLLLPLGEANPAVGAVLDSVRWDLQAYLLASAYDRHRPPPVLHDLFRVYDAGRFPCGWRGKYPAGELLVL